MNIFQLIRLACSTNNRRLRDTGEAFNGFILAFYLIGNFNVGALYDKRFRNVIYNYNGRAMTN